VGSSPSWVKSKPKNVFVASLLRCIMKDKEKILVRNQANVFIDYGSYILSFAYMYLLEGNISQNVGV
jgi:hypothetical protein